MTDFQTRQGTETAPSPSRPRVHWRRNYASEAPSTTQKAAKPKVHFRRTHAPEAVIADMKSVAETEAVKTASGELIEHQRANVGRMRGVGVQSRNKDTRFSLERTLELQLEKKWFEDTIDGLMMEDDEGGEDELRSGERIREVVVGKMGRERIYQGQLGVLNEKLRGLKAN